MTAPRVGVVGVGAVGFHHARVLRRLGGVRLSGVRDQDPTRAREVARELDTEVFDDLPALASVSDGLVIAVPTSSHEPVACEALDLGVHVLIEKPLAGSLEAADRILRLAERRGLLVQVGHVERFNPVVAAARSHVRAPLFIDAQRLAPFAPRASDVDVVLDLMVHDVDLTLSLVGRPVREVAAVGVAVLSGSVDIANARLSFEGGAVATLTASRVSAERIRTLRVFQPSGYLSLDLARGEGEWLRLPSTVADDSRAAPGARGSALPDRVALPVRSDEPLALELAAFRDALEGKVTRTGASGPEARAALAVTLAIQRRIEAHVVDTDAP